jgi:probable biosynthetic protein (TIGR04098 family)
MAPYHYDLTLGLPHTNRRGLWEPLLLQQAGHLQWQSIARAIGRPLSGLRTKAGGEVYAAFYYIEEALPDSAPLESFGLDDTLRFTVALRSFKNLAVEGRVAFDRAERMASPQADAAHPTIRFGNIFITPVKGNSELRVAPPANADFSGLAALPNDENPYHLTREARDTGRMGLIDEGWVMAAGPVEYPYAIDEDRDTNGAGLVYFANYITFAEAAERWTFRHAALPQGERSLRHRRTAFFGNADPNDTVRVRVSVFTHPQRTACLALRYTIERQQDGQRIALSEAIKVVA